MIERLSTRDMSREDWLKQRKKSIGGSDAGSVLGLNPFKSAYTLWAEKTGKIVPEDISDKEAVRLGNDLEQYVADRFTEATEIPLRNDTFIWRNDKYPFAHANIDRRVVGQKAGFEAKTTSSFDVLKKCQEGEYPETWYAQIMHYLMVTEFDAWYLGVLVLGHGFYWFKIERNEAEIKALIYAEQEFWKHVTDDTPPAIDGSESTSETLRTLYKGEINDGTVDITAYEDEVEMYLSFKAQAEEAKKKAEEKANILKEYMKDARYGISDKYKIDWAYRRGRMTFDKDAYEAAYGPIPEEFYKLSAPTRAFSAKEIKKKNK